MSYQFKLEKIMNLKEREKDESVGEYNEAVKAFQEVGQRLYELLKKKEDLESVKHTQIRKKISISEIQQTERFIKSLEQSIMHVQQLVAQSREKMNVKEVKLVEKNIEVKKFERIKENQWNSHQESLKFEEKKLMDEISIQQYMHRGS
ncbi:flagellar export protein FliJ [Bacillus solimangrovi]|uniref:Flagellar FliJ protein n=1 Tax=Bacillus solimangrovi TaxID=1305675 RepID=A0A1E5LAZ9_9BACI|nr:flagellar export protein FliJ [Bacillus solimangrovi]OEH91262.1 flagellar export protein FliJ [Bacillus solimangrovi]